MIEIKVAQQQGADYLGVGAVFSTSTKTDATEETLVYSRREDPLVVRKSFTAVYFRLF